MPKAKAPKDAIVGPNLPTDKYKGTKWAAEKEVVCVTRPLIFQVPMRATFPEGQLGDHEFMTAFSKVTAEAGSYITHLDRCVKEEADISKVFDELSDDEKKQYVASNYDEDYWPIYGPFIEIQKVADNLGDALVERLTSQMGIATPAYRPPPAAAGGQQAPPPRLSDAEKARSETKARKLATIRALFASAEIDWEKMEVKGVLSKPNFHDAFEAVLDMSSEQNQATELRAMWNSVLDPAETDMFDATAATDDRKDVEIEGACDFICKLTVSGKLESRPVKDPTKSQPKLTIWNFIAPRSPEQKERREEYMQKLERQANEDLMGQNETNREAKDLVANIYGDIICWDDVTKLLSAIKSWIVTMEKTKGVGKKHSVPFQCVERGCWQV